MKKQSNTNRKPGEAAAYYAGTINLDGVDTRVLFTEAELKRPRERAAKQPEEFKTGNATGIFATIKGWFK